MPAVRGAAPAAVAALAPVELYIEQVLAESAAPAPALCTAPAAAVEYLTQMPAVSVAPAPTVLLPCVQLQRQCQSTALVR